MWKNLSHCTNKQNIVISPEVINRTQIEPVSTNLVPFEQVKRPWIFHSKISKRLKPLKNFTLNFIKFYYTFQKVSTEISAEFSREISERHNHNKNRKTKACHKKYSFFYIYTTKMTGLFFLFFFVFVY